MSYSGRSRACEMRMNDLTLAENRHGARARSGQLYTSSFKGSLGVVISLEKARNDAVKPAL